MRFSKMLKEAKYFCTLVFTNYSMSFKGLTINWTAETITLYLGSLCRPDVLLWTMEFNTRMTGSEIRRYQTLFNRIINRIKSHGNKTDSNACSKNR